MSWSFKFTKISSEIAKAMRQDLPFGPTQFSEEAFSKFCDEVEKSIAEFNFEELNTILGNAESPTIPIFITYGIDRLYDSWTVPSEHGTAIVFNAEGFSFKFGKEGCLVLVHELVHLLISDKLPLLQDDDFLGHYNRMMIDEGLAHFLSFPRREKLLDYRHYYQAEWEWAEQSFFDSQKKLYSNISTQEKMTILFEGNTGPYWKKHAAIYGMFYFSEIFRTKGLKGCLDRLSSFGQFPNLNTFFADDLYDYPEVPSHLIQYIEKESNDLPSLEGLDKYKKVSRLAVHYRQIRNYDKAHEFFKLASEFFESSHQQMRIINFIRWADVFRQQKKFIEASTLLLQAEKLINQINFLDYKDFYKQHLGKLLFDQQNYEKALSCFNDAYDLRTKKGNTELILSTEFALKITRKKLGYES